ncbi:MAG: glycosyltransferase [Lachnospiraceae bacterium]|nr:glycosyltransferase [Lachnospiraceae bacterium]
MGAAEAEVLGIPVVNVTLQTEMIPQRRKPLTFKDKIVGKIVSRQICKPYNKVRKVYNLPPLADSGDLISGKVNLIPISAHVKERNPYWEEHHIMTGYWYEEDGDYVPDAALSEFLQKGDAPIILALGAMSFESESDRQKLDMFVAAFQETGKRAVIQGFQKTLQDYVLPDTMISCGSVPHSWLFRQGYAVIHHCGFGTSSAAMLYGIPSIPVPHVLDQIGFAKQMEALGVSTKMIPAKELSASRLILAINELSENYDTFSKTVRSLSEKLRAENGLDTAVSEIDKILHGTGA